MHTVRIAEAPSGKYVGGRCSVFQQDVESGAKVDWLDKVIDYSIRQGSDHLVLVLLLYGLILRPVLRRLSGVSGYIRRFLALQRQHSRNEKALVDVLQELSANLKERRAKHYLEERDCK